MKKRKLLYIVLSFVLIFTIMFIINMQSGKKQSIITIRKNWKINPLVYEVINNSDLTIYKETYQKKVEKDINKKKSKGNYTFSKPLLYINPYGTNMTGLYIYFETDEEVAIEYTIEVSDKDIPDYSNMLVGDISNKHEGQIIGLMQGRKNILTLRMLDKDLNVIKEKKFKINLPVYDPDTIEFIDIVEVGKIEYLTDGLFFPTNTKNDSTGSSKSLGLYDNNGVLRAQFIGESGIVGNSIQFTEEGDLIYSYLTSGKKTIRVNKYGRIVDIYNKITYTHEFLYKDNMIYSASGGTDGIYEYNTNTHESKELFNFRTVMSELYKKSMDYYYATTTDTELEIDWLHLNSIDFVNENDVVVSSRETSSIFYVENLFTDPKIRYIIGPFEIWKGTGFEHLLLTKRGDFVDQLGQHTIRVEHSDELNDGEYYLYMFNNNSVHSKKIPNYNWGNQYTSAGTPSVYKSVSSKYYKYLVSENNDNFQLVKSFDVTYRASRGGVQHYGNNIVVGSGTSLIYAEYTSEGELVIKYSLKGKTNEMTRAEKYDFKNVWFGTLKEYINYK